MAYNPKETTHPAFAMACFHRIHGNPGNLFGSSVNCDQYMELEIVPGVEVEDGCYHTFSGHGRPIIKIAFSPAQFADLLTTTGIGYGTPCTLEEFNGQKIEKIPDDKHINELDRQKAKFKEEMSELSASLKKKRERVKELCAKPKLNKEERKDLECMLDRGIMDIDSNIPFYMELFQEGTDTIVQHAKAEIDATVQHCVVSAGIKALGEEFKQREMMIENKLEE